MTHVRTCDLAKCRREAVTLPTFQDDLCHKQNSRSISTVRYSISSLDAFLVKTQHFHSLFSLSAEVSEHTHHVPSDGAGMKTAVGAEKGSTPTIETGPGKGL